MNNKNLSKAAIVLTLSVLAMLVAIMFTNFKYPKQSQGTMVFGNSYKNGLELDRIEINNGNNKITLELKDSLWRVRQADDYYANTYLLSSLLTNLNNSVFYSRQDIALNEGTKIETFAKDKMQDSILIGPATQNSLYRFAKLSNGEVWLISGHFELPKEAYSWLLQPILELPSSLIETIRFREQDKISEFGRKDEYADFSNQKHQTIKAKEQLQLLSRLWAEDVRSAKNFDKQAYKVVQQMEVVTFQGLVFHFEFFEDAQKQSWISINLSTTPLPMTIINDYIRDNNFLYDGWYFKISPEARKILRESSLI